MNDEQTNSKLNKPFKSDDINKHSQPFNSMRVNEDSLTSYKNGHTSIDRAEEKSLVRFNHITYLLYAISFFTAGLLWIVPIVMNYLRRGDANGSWLATHFDWQIKTFWYSLIFGLIGGVLIFISLGGLGISALSESSGMAIGSVVMAFIGGLIIFAAVIWHLYRIVRGWIALADNRPI